MVHLSQETEPDWWEVEALYDAAFGQGREGLSSYRLREGVAPVAGLCRVARDADGALAGAIRVWPVDIGGHGALLIGPIAVHPTRQGEGLGAVLIWDVLRLGRACGWRRALLVGDAPYYGRFGFARLPGVVMPAPTNPDRVLGAELAEGAWRGVAGHVARMPHAAAAASAGA